jgi:HAE1 family hydrophobic/amphiphilic exporter-1
MTSYAFIAGLIPLTIASDPGKIGNRTLGSAAAGGMLIGTICGVLIIPGLYYIFGRISEKTQFVKNEDENPLTEDINDNV